MLAVALESVVSAVAIGALVGALVVFLARGKA